MYEPIESYQYWSSGTSDPCKKVYNMLCTFSNNGLWRHTWYTPGSDREISFSHLSSRLKWMCQQSLLASNLLNRRVELGGGQVPHVRLHQGRARPGGGKLHKHKSGRRQIYTNTFTWQFSALMLWQMLVTTGECLGSPSRPDQPFRPRRHPSGRPAGRGWRSEAYWVLGREYSRSDWSVPG